MSFADRRFLEWTVTAAVTVEVVARCLIVILTSEDEAKTQFTALGVTLLAGVIVAAIWCVRRHPAFAAWVGFGGSAAVEVFNYAALLEPLVLWTGFALLVVPYALGRRGNMVDITVSAAPMAISVATAVWAEARFTGMPLNASDAAGAAALLALCVAIGLVTRHRSDAQRSLRLSLQTQERERLARDLHDTVAHRVSAVTIQAQAGQVLLRSGDTAGTAQALAAIESESTAALQDMRAVVGALRDPNYVPIRYDVAEFADPDAHVPVRVTCRGATGSPPADVKEAIYRIVQESISNARRHAVNATEIAVTADYGHDGVSLSIVDDGTAPQQDTTGNGFGIMGMRERVTALGGTVQVGPHHNGGWAVTAHIPTQHPDHPTLADTAGRPEAASPASGAVASPEAGPKAPYEPEPLREPGGDT